MKRPLIGINCGLEKDLYYKLDQRYVQAVLDAGGMPVIMPFFTSRDEAKEFLSQLDGYLFTGGLDMDPSRWKAKPHPKSEILPKRKETSDVFAMQEALQTTRPILGICYGLQLLNVVCGGTLHQHLPDKVGKKVDHSGGAKHPVKFEEGSRLGDIMSSSEIEVSSYHHQAVNKVGKDLCVVGLAPDGVIEGMEMFARWVVAVQWHPERMQDQPWQKKLLTEFIAAASR